MIILFALILSVLLQFGAFFMTVSLIKKTKFNVSWITISLGFLLMAFRRLNEFVNIVTAESYGTETWINSWMAVVISLLMFIGSIYIRRIFKLQGKIDSMRKENEARVLSAIIKTEEKERKRFSKELHDGLGPLLASVKMAVSAINKDGMDSMNTTIINKTDYAINEAITTVKEISNNLSPHILEMFGLEKAIRSYIDKLILEKELKVNISSNLDKERFDANTEVTLFRIVGELYTNTVKYASASMVDISLVKADNKLEMKYSDNGRGFDLRREELKGLGLSNIRSRVKSLGGKMDIHTKQGQGFFLKIVLPVVEDIKVINKQMQAVR